MTENKKYYYFFNLPKRFALRPEKYLSDADIFINSGRHYIIGRYYNIPVTWIECTFNISSAFDDKEENLSIDLHIYPTESEWQRHPFKDMTDDEIDAAMEALINSGNAPAGNLFLSNRGFAPKDVNVVEYPGESEW